MKKLNILIPTYNRQELLLKNVKKISSFIKGNTQIVICDNSKLKIDNTFFSKNVSYFHNGQNLGFDGNVAECLDKSNSEYIWFFSDDDEMPEKTYNKVMKLIENSFPDRVLVDALVLDETNEIIIDSLSPTITNKKTIQIDNNTFHKFYEFSTLISSNVLKYSTINQSIINRFKGSCFTQLGLFWYDSIGLNLSIVNDFKIIKFDSKSNDFSKLDSEIWFKNWILTVGIFKDHYLISTIKKTSKKLYINSLFNKSRIYTHAVISRINNVFDFNDYKNIRAYIELNIMEKLCLIFVSICPVFLLKYVFLITKKIKNVFLNS